MLQITVAASLARTLVACSVLYCTLSTAAELRVMAPNAAKEPIVEAVAAFERATGHKTTVSWFGTEAITKRVTDGEATDVVINAAQNIDRLTAEGKLVQGTRSDFARSSVGVAVAASSAMRPDVSTVEGIKAALLEAKSIVISSGTSGRYLSDLFDRLGVGERIKSKVRQPPSGAQITDFLARGDAELGFQQVSELIHAKGVTYLGALPTEIQSYTVYSAAIHAKSAQPEATQTFLRTLRQAEVAASVRKSGMDPL